MRKMSQIKRMEMIRREVLLLRVKHKLMSKLIRHLLILKLRRAIRKLNRFRSKNKRNNLLKWKNKLKLLILMIYWVWEILQ
jgi:hypothetical protein